MYRNLIGDKIIKIERYIPPYEHKDKYYTWIEQLHNEILNMQNSIRIWQKITEIENKSEHFQKFGGHFQSWQNENFAYRVIIQLSRIVEYSRNDDDRSFLNFLYKIRDNQILSYQQYRKLWSKADMESAGYKEEDIEQIFEYTTGCKCTDVCLCKMYNEDIKKIQEINSSIRKMRNKIIAHLTKCNKDMPNVRYENIFHYVKTIDELINKYSRLLYGYFVEHEYTDLDVTTVFKKAWLE